MLDRKQATKMLGDIEVSDFAKDVMMAGAINIVADFVVGLPMNYMLRGGMVTEYGQGGDSKSLDPKRYFAPLRGIVADLFDTPLVLMGHYGESFIHDCCLSKLFDLTVPDIYSDDTDFYAYSLEHEMQSMAKYGIGHCFMDEMRVAAHIALISKSTKQAVIKHPEDLEFNKLVALNQVAAYLMMMKHQPIAKSVLQQYGDMIASTSGGKGSAYILSAAYREVLDRIIRPYRGNLLFLDFWGIGCGPCRAGMIDQREIVAHLADEPCRFLYIADEQDSPREPSEKFMTENSIKGEHIYVSHDDWQQLMQMFRFLGIPHGVLVAPDGTVLQNDFELHTLNEERLRELIKEYVK